MGKKKNKKFKKTISHSTPNVERKVNPIESSNNGTDEILPTQQGTSPEVLDEETQENDLLNQKYAYVRQDLKKLGIAIATLIILVIIIFIVNQKTGFLTPVGNWIYKIGNFQI